LVAGRLFGEGFTDTVNTYNRQQPLARVGDCDVLDGPLLGKEEKERKKKEDLREDSNFFHCGF